MSAALYNKALKLGATDFGDSERKGKRYMVVYQGKTIHFGSDVGSTYIDHRDGKKRQAWRARHTKIMNKDGDYVYTLKTSPSYWAYHLLW